MFTVGRLGPLAAASGAAWLASGDRSVIEVDSNAVRWLASHAREARPEVVVWDTAHLASTREAAGLRYWVDVGGEPERRGSRLVAHLDRATNSVEVDYDGDWLRLLLHEDMVDLAAPVTLHVNGEAHTVTAPTSLGVLAPV